MKLIKIVTALLFTALMAAVIASLTGLNAPLLFVGLVVIGLLTPKTKGALMMAIQAEIWEKDIIDLLYKNNQFAELAFSADQYVNAENGYLVHIPNAGANNPSVINPANFPLAANQRTDFDVTYPLDAIVQPPRFVTNLEQAQLSYNKRQSLVGGMNKQLIQDGMNRLLYNWAWLASNNNTSIGTAPGAYVLTDGPATSTDLLAGATGEWATLTQDVFSQIVKSFNAADIPMDGRIALLTAFHHQQFLDSLSDSAKTNFNAFADMKTGVVGMFLGFKFMMRSSVQYWRYNAGIYSPVDTQAVGFAAGPNDCAASLIYQVDCVERARGNVKVYDNPDRAEYQGDLFSMNMRLGGRQRRSAGVVSVVEAIVTA